MLGVLPDGVSEVDALREEIEGLQWSLAYVRGEADNCFFGVDAHTGERDVQFLALALPTGALVDVEDENGDVTRFVRVHGMLADEGWLEVGEYDGGMRDDKYVCSMARAGGGVVVRRPGLADKDIDVSGVEASFACVDGYTGQETSYRVSGLLVGTVILVEDEGKGDVVYARADGGPCKWWRTIVRLGDTWRCDAPSADDLVAGASGRPPVVYQGIG